MEEKEEAIAERVPTEMTPSRAVTAEPTDLDELPEWLRDAPTPEAAAQAELEPVSVAADAQALAVATPASADSQDQGALSHDEDGKSELEPPDSSLDPQPSNELVQFQPLTKENDSPQVPSGDQPEEGDATSSPESHVEAVSPEGASEEPSAIEAELAAPESLGETRIQSGAGNLAQAETATADMVESSAIDTMQQQVGTAASLPSESEERAGAMPVEDELPDWLQELAPAPQCPIEDTSSNIGLLPQHLEGTPESSEPAVSVEPEPPTKATILDSEEPASASNPTWREETIELPPSIESGLEATAIVEEGHSEEPGASQTPSADQTEAAEPLSSKAPATDKADDAGFPDWMRELKRPADISPPKGGTPLRTEPPQLRMDELEELPDWLREPLGLGSAEGAAASSRQEPRSSAQLTESEPTDQGAKYQGQIPSVEETSEEAAETDGLLGGVRGLLPLAISATKPHTVTPPSSKQNDGALVFEAVLAAAAAGSVTAMPASAPHVRRSWSKWWIYPLVLIAALIPLFIPPNLAGFGLAVSNRTPTAAFYDKIQSLSSGSTVLLAFDYDTGQSVELNPAARAVVQDLARRHVNVVALSTIPAGVQIAQTILDQASQQNAGWNPGENYVNFGYIPGGEAGLRSLADNWPPIDRNSASRSLPLALKAKGLRDFSLAIEFAGGGESLRAWMEQVQPRGQVAFVAVVSAAVEAQARNYLAASQLTAFLRGLGGAAEYELFSNQAGLAVRTVDALSFSHLAILAVIILGNLVFILEFLTSPKPSKR